MTSDAAGIPVVAPDPQSPYYYVTSLEAASPWRASLRQSLQIALSIAYLFGAPGLIVGLSYSWEFAVGALALSSALALVLCVLPLPFYYYCNRATAAAHFPRIVDYSADSDEIVVAFKNDHWSTSLRDCGWATGTTLQGEHGEFFPARDAVLLHVGYNYAGGFGIPCLIWVEDGAVGDRWRRQLASMDLPTFDPPRHRHKSLQLPPEAKRAGIGACLGITIALVIDNLLTLLGYDLPSVSVFLYAYATGGFLGYVGAAWRYVSQIGPIVFAIQVFVTNMFLVVWSKQGDDLTTLGVCVLVGLYALTCIIVGLIYAQTQHGAETQQE